MRGCSTTAAALFRSARSATCGSRAIRCAPATGISTRRRRAPSRGAGFARATNTTQDADGYFWYAGRSDDMLKVGGLWVSPVEVENALVAQLRARMRRGGARGSRRAHQADGVCRARAGRWRGRRSWRRSSSSSSASGWRNTSGRGGSSFCRSCRRRRPARFSGSGCATWQGSAQRSVST